LGCVEILPKTRNARSYLLSGGVFYA